MATIEEQYADLLTQTQDEALTALGTWNRTVRRTLRQLPATGLTSMGELVDEAYEYASQVLDARRKFAKQLIATGAAAVEAVEKASEGVAPVAGDGAEKSPAGKSTTAKAAH